MTNKRSKNVQADTAASRRQPDIVISSSEGTLFGQVKSVKDKDTADRAIARLLAFDGKHSTRPAGA